jgi:opacity protein-like surface antigen
MRFILAALAATFSTAALAADMPVKAPPFAYPLDSAGWYVGVDAGASVAKASLTGPSLFGSNLVTG